MNEAQKETMIGWLNDAHAMELSLIENLEQKSKDAETEGKTEVKNKIDEHITETQNHAEQVEACIIRLGGTVSKGKDLVGKITGYVQGNMKTLFKDTMVKNALESYAAEQFEIAAYTSLIAAAEEVGDTKTAEVCLKIIEDEEAMAEWAMEQILESTVEHINAQK